MRSLQAEAIRAARTAVGLTQEQLASRIGLKGRAIYRWERDAAAPTRRNRAALVTAIALLDEAAGASLKSAFTQKSAEEVVAETAARAAAQISQEMALEMAIMGLADGLDVAPRRTRIALLRMCKQLGQAGLTLESLQSSLEKALHEGALSSVSFSG